MIHLLGAFPSTGLTLQLNAGAIAPEGAVLVALVVCLLVDLAGEKAASRDRLPGSGGRVHPAVADAQLALCGAQRHTGG